MPNNPSETSFHLRISSHRERSLPDNEKFNIHSRALSASIGEFALESLSSYKRSVAPNTKIPEVAFQKLNAQMITHWFFLPINKKNGDKPQSRAGLLSRGIINIDQLDFDLEPITSSIATMYSKAAQLIAEGAPIPDNLDSAELVNFLTYLSARFSSMDSRELSTSDNTVRTRFLAGVLRYSAEHINKINRRLRIIRDDGPLCTRIRERYSATPVPTNSDSTHQTPRKTTGELKSALL